MKMILLFTLILTTFGAQAATEQAINDDANFMIDAKVAKCTAEIRERTSGYTLDYRNATWSDKLIGKYTTTLQYIVVKGDDVIAGVAKLIIFQDATKKQDVVQKREVTGCQISVEMNVQ